MDPFESPPTTMTSYPTILLAAWKFASETIVLRTIFTIVLVFNVGHKFLVFFFVSFVFCFCHNYSLLLYQKILCIISHNRSYYFRELYFEKEESLICPPLINNHYSVLSSFRNLLALYSSSILPFLVKWRM